MNEPVIKQRPSVDLDDFERRLRQASTRGHDEDPLAELARLVGDQNDPYGDVFSRGPAANHPDSDGYRQAPHHAVGAGAQPSRLPGDFAAIEAGLRGTAHTHGSYGGEAAPSSGQLGYPDHAQYGEQPDHYRQNEQEQDWSNRQAYAAEPPRSHRPVYIMALTIAVGVLGIGTAFALKGRISSSPSEIKTIMADTGPTKVQPPSASSDRDHQDANASESGSKAATQLVSREEQPVDVAQAVKDRVALAGSTATDASTVPVPLSPGQTQASDSGFGLSDMPPPKRVKVVSVRPDGTILPDDQPPAAAIPSTRPAPIKSSDRVVPLAKATTPKAPAAKSTARATATPKTIESLAGDDDGAPAKPVKKVKPQRVASADTGEQATSEAVAPSSAGPSGFAVQLAAPGSEAEAKAASARLSKKFADSLGDYRLGFHKAESNGKSVYRVRVSSLSRADAVSLCEKLKADGGSCFVAKN